MRTQIRQCRNRYGFAGTCYVHAMCVHVPRVHVADASDRVVDPWVTIGTMNRIASSLSACAFKMQEAEAALMAVICQTGSDDGSERCELFVSACAWMYAWAVARKFHCCGRYLP